MGEIDKRNILDEEPFEFMIMKDQKLQIFWNKKSVMILKGEKAKGIISKLERANEKEKQLILAKITGNFKRGNEKTSKNMRK